MLSSSLESSLAFWEVVEYVAEGIVIVGAVGDGLGEFTDFLGAKHCQKTKDLVLKISTLILIVGLAVELGSLVRTNELSGRLIADSIRKAGDAKTSADSAATAAARADASAQRANLAAGNALKSAAAIEKEAALLRDQLLRQDLRAHLLQDRKRRTVFISQLRQFSGQAVAIRQCAGSTSDSEMTFLSLNLVWAFPAGTWKVGDKGPTLVGCGTAIIVGIDRKAPDSTREGAEPLVKALVEIGLMSARSTLARTPGLPSDAKTKYLETPGVDGILVGVGAHP